MSDIEHLKDPQMKHFIGDFFELVSVVLLILNVTVCNSLVNDWT